MKVLKMESILWFGKHKGKTVKEIINKFPEYINWMKNNMTNVVFSDSVKSDRGFRLSINSSFHIPSVPSYASPMVDDRDWIDDDCLPGNTNDFGDN